jgi:hypothetical protein
MDAIMGSISFPFYVYFSCIYPIAEVLYYAEELKKISYDLTQGCSN